MPFGFHLRLFDWSVMSSNCRYSFKKMIGFVKCHGDLISALH
ncbi:hypothetical protein sync_1809 [Synechococcus sp. CC9311]|nr:hypothetical protein sync_1809 [Synechococcus sp. CC9311]